MTVFTIIGIIAELGFAIYLLRKGILGIYFVAMWSGLFDSRELLAKIYLVGCVIIGGILIWHVYSNINIAVSVHTAL